MLPCSRTGCCEGFRKQGRRDVGTRQESEVRPRPGGQTEGAGLVAAGCCVQTRACSDLLNVHQGRGSYPAIHVLGREVALLASGVVEAGRHTATFVAEGLPSGIYLVRLETPAGVETQAVSLVK